MVKLNPFVWVAVAFLVSWPELVLDYPDWLRDGVRVIELVESVIVLVITASVARRYFLNYRADATAARLLPRHVMLVAFGVGLLTVAVTIACLKLIGHPFIWYVTPLVLPAMTSIAFALVDVLVWLPNRTAPPLDGLRRADDPKHNEERR